MCWGLSGGAPPHPRFRFPAAPGLQGLVSGCTVENALPLAAWSVFWGGLVVFQGTPHWAGHISPSLGHVFSPFFILGLPVLSAVNEIIVTSLPLNYHGLLLFFPHMPRGSPPGHLAASLPDGTGAWIFEVGWIPETFLLRPSLDGVPGPGPQPHPGTWPARSAAPHTTGTH